MIIIESLFKEYDVRGVYGKELNRKFAYDFGLAVGTYAKKKFNANNILVGTDLRKSSKPLFESFLEGVNETGVNVIYIGICSTPMFYFALNKLKQKFGIMITASHNPPNYNGFKAVGNKGNIGYIDGLNRIEEIMNTKNFYVAKKKGKLIKTKITKYYERFFKKTFKKKIKKRVIIDPNVLGAVEAKILKKYCDAIVIIRKKNIELNPLEEKCQKIIKIEVLKKKADLGILFDGDVDRVVFIDEKGKMIAPDIISVLLVKYAMKKGGKIVYSLVHTKALLDEAKKKGVEAIICKNGRTNITRKMRQTKADIGAEKSAHYFFKEFNYFDCPLIVIAKVFDIIRRYGNISKLVTEFKRYYDSGELNFSVEEEEKDKILKKIERCYDKKNYRKKLKLDGISFYFKNWWFNLRKSNTQNMIRLNIEANSKKLLREKVLELKFLIRSFITRNSRQKLKNINSK